MSAESQNSPNPSGPANPWLDVIAQQLKEAQTPTALGRSAISFRARYLDRWNEEYLRGSWDKLVVKDSIGVFARALAEGRALNGIASVDLELFRALDCAYADRWDYAQRFLMRCLDAAAWTETSGALHCGPLAEYGYPRTLGEVRLFRAYARWLLGGPFDRKVVEESARLSLIWMETSGEAVRGKVTKDPAPQEWCIDGIRAAVLSGSLEFAREQLKRFKLGWYMEEERQLYLRLVQECPKISANLRLDFERWFDRAREPDAAPWHPELRYNFGFDQTRLEVGIMRQMYLVNASPNDPIDARAVIEAIRA